MFCNLFDRDGHVMVRSEKRTREVRPAGSSFFPLFMLRSACRSLQLRSLDKRWSDNRWSSSSSTLILNAIEKDAAKLLSVVKKRVEMRGSLLSQV